MRIRTPRWWYFRGRPAPVTRALLWPLSLLWAAGTARRIARARPSDAGVPVICVGNLTVGGSGKTPVAREVARLLRVAGLETHVLARGYGGRMAGPVRVDPLLHTARDVGDEPLMMAGDGPVWVARDRADGAMTAVEAGAQVVVMDDGHQNPDVKKWLSLVVVDGETRGQEWPFGDGSVFPSGPLREPLARGLVRADAVVVLLPADIPEVDPALRDALDGKKVLVAHLVPTCSPPAGPLLGFAGIAKPWRMERAIQAAGGALADFAPFPDHAAISDSSLGFLARRAGELGAVLVTSEKDWARLSPAWRTRVQAWPVRVRFEDEGALMDLLRDLWERDLRPPP
ncbi:MAG TPA: tetraacyldisaccharide 4'-kinase [Caulobacteraceae bacterium]